MSNKFKECNSGVAAIEFAIILPFMLLVFFGVVELSRYIMVIRKADEVANDIGYLLSREGCIAHDSYSTCDTLIQQTNASFTGGVNELHEIEDAVTPFLLYPLVDYDTAKANNQLDFDVALDGLPTNFEPPAACTSAGIGLTTNSPGQQPTPNGINYTDYRIMWYDHYPAQNTISVNLTGNTNSAQPCTAGSICPLACNNKVYNSNAENHVGVTTDIIYPGQSFLNAGFTLQYQTVLGPNFLGLSLPSVFQKGSSYAVRSRYIGTANGTTAVQTNQIINDMQICTDCTIGSVYAQGSDVYYLSEQGGVTAGAVSKPLRQACVPNSVAQGYKKSNMNLYNAGGCTFQ